MRDTSPAGGEWGCAVAICKTEYLAAGFKHSLIILTEKSVNCIKASLLIPSSVFHLQCVCIVYMMPFVALCVFTHVYTVTRLWNETLGRF